MNFITKLLKKWNLLPDFSEDERLNASTEEALREHSTQIQKVREVTRNRKRGNAALRHSIFVAKARSNSFADFEVFMGRKGDHGGGNAL